MDQNEPVDPGRLNAQDVVESRPKWMEIDTSFGDFATLGKYHQICQHFRDFAKIIKPSTSVRDYKNQLRLIQDLDPTLCPETKAILNKTTFLTDEDRDVMITDVLTTRVAISKKASDESIKCSVAVGIAQVVSLWNAWKEIRSGEYVVAESKLDLPEIQAKVTILEQFCEEINEMIEQFKKLDKNDSKFLKMQQTLLRRIESQYKQIVSAYSDVKLKISDLQLNVDSQLVQLKFTKIEHMENVAKKAAIFPKLLDSTINFTLGVTGILNLVSVKACESKIDKLKDIASKIYHLDLLLKEVEEIKDFARTFLDEHGQLEDSEEEESDIEDDEGRRRDELFDTGTSAEESGENSDASDNMR